VFLFIDFVRVTNCFYDYDYDYDTPMKLDVKDEDYKFSDRKPAFVTYVWL